MIGCAQPQISTSSAENCLPKVARKKRIPIRDQDFRHDMQLVNVIDEKFSNFGSSVGMLKRQKMSKLGKLVNNNKNAIKLT
jgi:hypothetical protein